MQASSVVDPRKIVLYVEDTFDKANPTPGELEAMKAAAADLGASGFDTVILAFLHPKMDGTLYYNNIPFSGTLSFLPSMVAAIKARGIVSRVLLSIGPFAEDYAAINSNVPRFKQTFADLVTRVGLDGVDFDLEEDYDTFSDLLVDLTGWVSNAGRSVTAAPFQREDYWIKVLQRTSPGGRSWFAWWNLQIYGGADYGTWVSYLSGLADNPQGFLVPGYNVYAGTTPTSLESTLRDLKSSYPSLAGSFVWQYELIKQYGYTASQFAAAIKAGLGS